MRTPAEEGTPVITHEQVTEILVQLAQLNERQKAMDEAGDHRHNNLKMALDGLASKKDVEAANERIGNLKEALEAQKTALSGRITQLETNQSRVVWALLGTMGSVVIQALGLTKKLGF